MGERAGWGLNALLQLLNIILLLASLFYSRCLSESSAMRMPRLCRSSFSKTTCAGGDTQPLLRRCRDVQHDLLVPFFAQSVLISKVLIAPDSSDGLMVNMSAFSQISSSFH